jgi:mRNA interferase RelE/StbE
MFSAYEIDYHPDVVRIDLPRLSTSAKQQIKKSVESKLCHAPNRFGLPLKRSLKGYWKLRVGDYRVIFKIVGSRVRIYRIGHRSEVYSLPIR